MPYNPKKDAYQVMGRKYKAALKWLADSQHNTDRNTVEKLIDSAIRAQGKTVNYFNPKE